MNDDLRGKITVYINGKILQNIAALSVFPIEFLSNLSFLFRKYTYALDENIIIENLPGNELFFVVTGKVAVLHR